MSENALQGSLVGLPNVVRLWEAVCNNATVAMFIMDERQHCIYMNPAAERLTGYSLEETQGRPLHDVVHHTRPDGTAYPLEECPIDRAFPENVQEQGEEVFVHKDGSFYPVAYTASPIRDRSAKVVGTIIEVRDIKAEKEAEEALHAETRMLEALNRFGTEVAGELDLDRLVQSVTEAGVQLTGAAFGAFFYNVTDQEGERYTLYTIAGAPREAFSKFPMPRNTEVFDPTFRGTGTVRSDDITKDSRYGKNPPYHGMPPGHLPVRSYLAVPVVSSSGEVHGGLFFGHPEPGVFTGRAERLVVGIAAQAAIALDNARLFQEAQQEIKERTEAQRQLRLLLDELNHRVKNTLAAVQAIALQTLRGTEVPAGVRESFMNRLLALSRVHNLLSEKNWRGAALHDLLRQALAAYALEDGRRVHIDGPPVSLRPKLAQSFAMAFHELATNAAKHGALSEEAGRVEVTWSLDPGQDGAVFRWRWRETGGPPVAPPSRTGFGTRLLQESLAHEIGATVRLRYDAQGLICSIEAPQFRP